MRELGRDEDDIHQFIAAEGLPREPTTLSAVQRIVAVTGASVAEVLALLGIDDMTRRRTPHQEKDYPRDSANSGAEAGKA